MEWRKYWGKPALVALLWYTISFAVIEGMHASGQFKSGPCNPGLDVILFMLFVAVSVILLLIATSKAIKRKGAYITAAAIHVSVALVFIILTVIAMRQE